jgi:hypothetical protein
MQTDEQVLSASGPDAMPDGLAPLFLPSAAVVAVACLVGWFFVSPFGFLYLSTLAMWIVFLSLARRGVRDGSMRKGGFFLRLFLITLANMALLAAAAPRIALSPTSPANPTEPTVSASAEPVGDPISASGESAFPDSR